MRMRVSFEHDSKLFPGLFSLRDLTPPNISNFDPTCPKLKTCSETKKFQVPLMSPANK